ncbi:hypothetical protein Emag_007612 [Eimeria magna]
MVAQARVWMGAFGVRGGVPRRGGCRLPAVAPPLLEPEAQRRKLRVAQQADPRAAGSPAADRQCLGAQAERRSRRGEAVPQQRRVAVAPVEPGARERGLHARDQDGTMQG